MGGIKFTSERRLTHVYILIFADLLKKNVKLTIFSLYLILIFHFFAVFKVLSRARNL